MTKHTPGPWTKGGDCEDWGVSPPRNVSLASSQPITAKGRKDPVCYIVQRDKREYGDGDAEFDANADLIAAAPQLLDAVRDYAGALEFFAKKDEREGDREGANLKRLTLARIDAIIAAAEGR